LAAPYDWLVLLVMGLVVWLSRSRIRKIGFDIRKRASKVSPFDFFAPLIVVPCFVAAMLVQPQTTLIVLILALVISIVIQVFVRLRAQHLQLQNSG
jgi:phosphatidylserine synthase